MIKRIKKIPHLVKETAPACAESLSKAITAALAAGHGPSGEAWSQTETGARALPAAASEATITKAVGTTLITASQFPYGFHDRGARGGALPVRKVVPTSLTANLAAAIKRPLLEAFNRKVR